MQDDRPVHFDDLAQILHNAHLRRSADFGHWLKQYLDDRRRAGTHREARPVMNTVVSLISRPHQKAV